MGSRESGSLPLDERSGDSRAGPLLIDCDTCLVRGASCADCVVTFLLGGPPDAVAPDRAQSGAGTVELNAEELGALDALAGSGMVPPLRLVTAVETVVVSDER